jgi:hypothetical protein
MLYKLVKITDLDGKDKTDAKAVNRLGRIFDIDADKIEINKRLHMECVEPSVLKSLLTSWIKNVTRADDGLIITTENSIYFLVEKEIADWYEEQEYQRNVKMASHFDMNGDPI